MSPSVRRQMVVTLKTFSTLRTLELARMRVHMASKGDLGFELFATHGTRVQFFCVVFFHVSVQVTFRREQFVAHRTQMRRWLVFIRTFNDIVTINFSL